MLLLERIERSCYKENMITNVKISHNQAMQASTKITLFMFQPSLQKGHVNFQTYANIITPIHLKDYSLEDVDAYY